MHSRDNRCILEKFIRFEKRSSTLIKMETHLCKRDGTGTLSSETFILSGCGEGGGGLLPCQACRCLLWRPPRQQYSSTVVWINWLIDWGRVMLTGMLLTSPWLAVDQMLQTSAGSVASKWLQAIDRWTRLSLVKRTWTTNEPSSVSVHDSNLEGIFSKTSRSSVTPQ